MSIRNIGAFASGAMMGAQQGLNMRGQYMGQEHQAEEWKNQSEYYKALSGMIEDFRNGRGPWAAEAPTRANPAVSSNMTGNNPAPDAYGPPASMGGGSAADLMQRGLGAQQPASAFAKSAAQGYATPPMFPEKQGWRSLPFAEFAGY